MAQGLVIWLTGLPGSGKSTIAAELGARLRERGERVEILDGDELRQRLSPELGYSRADREMHAHRTAYMAELLARNGVVVLVALVSPFAATRAAARRTISRFLEVHVNCSLAECERRDPKGLYAAARAGRVAGVTGVDAPYEAPLEPEVRVDTEHTSLARTCDAILEKFEHIRS
jgi:adenylylsulfate kinase